MRIQWSAWMLHFVCTMSRAGSEFPTGFSAFGLGFDLVALLFPVGRTQLGLERGRLMNAPLHPEVLIRRDASTQVDLPLAAEGTLRYVFESRFGDILIEVKGGQAFVNGRAVEPPDQVDDDSK
jgi:hypothetical protein